MKKLALLMVVCFTCSRYTGRLRIQNGPAGDHLHRGQPHGGNDLRHRQRLNSPQRQSLSLFPNATGGGSDLTARAVAQFSQKYLGRSRWWSKTEKAAARR